VAEDGPTIVLECRGNLRRRYCRIGDRTCIRTEVKLPYVTFDVDSFRLAGEQVFELRGVELYVTHATDCKAGGSMELRRKGGSGNCAKREEKNAASYESLHTVSRFEQVS
jgi:hypothetical protein